MRTTAALSLLFLFSFSTQDASERAAWNQPVEPFRIAGTVYYVGAAGVSAFLIRTSEGAVLLHGGLPETAPLIAASIAKLGVDIRDVKQILHSHAHYDHVGGIAELKRLSGASLAVSAPDAKVMEAGGPNMPAVKVDRIIADGDTVTLGGATLTAHLTPGHTKGCTTWTMTTKEADRAYDVLFHCSSSIVDKLVGNQGYPNIVEDYETSFAKIRALKADIFLANHPFFFRMEQKRAAMKDRAPNPFVDPSELQRFNDQQEQRFKEALEKR